MNTMAQEMARNVELQRRMATTQSKQLELKACKETEAIASKIKSTWEKYNNSSIQIWMST